MRLTKGQLRRIIRKERRLLEMHAGAQLEPEHWDIVPSPDFGGAPCPHGVAAAIQGSAASDADIISWIHALTMDLVGGAVEDEEALDLVVPAAGMAGY